MEDEHYGPTMMWEEEDDNDDGNSDDKEEEDGGEYNDDNDDEEEEAWEEEDNNCDDYDGVEVLDDSKLPSLRQAGSCGVGGGGKTRAGWLFPGFAPPTARRPGGEEIEGIWLGRRSRC